MSFIERIKILREFSGLSQAKFCAVVGLNLDSYRKIEQGRNVSINFSDLDALSTNEEFGRYFYWVLTGITSPEGGQISPHGDTPQETKSPKIKANSHK